MHLYLLSLPVFNVMTSYEKEMLFMQIVVGNRNGVMIQMDLILRQYGGGKLGD